MSPVTAVCLALAGVALLPLGPRAVRRWHAMAVGSIASIIVSMAVVALLGYALGLPGAYGWAQLTRIAMHTAIGIGLIGAGLFVVGWRIGIHPGEHTPAGSLSPWRWPS